MVSSWSRPTFNLNLGAWRRMRRTYDDPVAPLLNVRFRTAGVLFSALDRLQESLFGDALDRLQVKPPVFILGHWRSGTTLLHELLGLDPSFLSPSTFECFNPHHFLLSSASQLAEAQQTVVRPTGDLVVRASSPQEEEFALLCRGAVSPYEAFLFPEALGTLDKLCDPDQFGEAGARAWDRTLVSFLKGVCYSRGRDKRLLLKSPTNSFRVARLQKLFPEATFVTLVRESEAVFRSTLAMWEKMWDRYAVGGLCNGPLWRDRHVLSKPCWKRSLRRPRGSCLQIGTQLPDMKILSLTHSVPSHEYTNYWIWAIPPDYFPSSKSIYQALKGPAFV